MPARRATRAALARIAAVAIALGLVMLPHAAAAADLAPRLDDLAPLVNSLAPLVDSLAAHVDSLAGRGPDADSMASTAPESLAAFPAPRVRAWQVGIVRPDRLEHAGLSFSLGVALTIAFRDRLPAAAVTLALGAGKEYWDSRHSHAEALDLVADAAGLGLALVLVRGRAP